MAVWDTALQFNQCMHERFTGLPSGLHFNPDTYTIPTEKPLEIPKESPYPQNPKFLYTHTAHPVSFRYMHFLNKHVYAVSIQ